MMSKRILGLDLGPASLGWAYVVSDDDGTFEIIGTGVRIIPLNAEEAEGFTKGQTFTKNQQRTIKRQARRNLDRYQQRRSHLKAILQALSMYPSEDLILNIEKNKLWELRHKAVTTQISLEEIGRIFLQLNQRRGYASKKRVQDEESKKSDYLEGLENRYAEIHRQKITVGQYFHQKLKENPHYRVKNKVFPRAAYEEEFDQIWNTQKAYYPHVFTKANYKKIKKETIYYQRDLKSQKRLVSVCEFEGKLKNGRLIGPKVAAKSNPLFQIEKIWESIHNIRIKNSNGKRKKMSLVQKTQLFNALNQADHLSQKELFNLLNIDPDDGWYTNKNIETKGLQGNLTYAKLKDILKGNAKVEELLAMKLTVRTRVIKKTGEPFVNKQTGRQTEIISDDFEHSALYRLWHIVYSLPEDQAKSKLLKEFPLTEQEAEALARIDFSTQGFGNKSIRFIRKILPYLQSGADYTEACIQAGYRHSESLSKEEIEKKELVDHLELIPKGALRQPIVEKVLNQLIHQLNAFLEDPRYGRPDEICIELGRALKQSKEERNKTFKTQTSREAKRKTIAKELQKANIKASNKNIMRYQLWKEFDYESPYEPGKKIGFSEVFGPTATYEVEHIIPKSVFFDDSFANKTLCPYHLNSGQGAKNKLTAYDYMATKGAHALEAYLAFIGKHRKKISRTKMARLLCKADQIPQDFINRQLRESQYIAKEAKRILNQVCHHVHSTSGTVTAFLRRHWGYEEVLKQINLEKYRTADQTEMVPYQHNGQQHEREEIIGWSKRDDHRHHALDAIVIACTSHSLIQRLNTYAQQSTREEMMEWVSQQQRRATSPKRKKILIEKYVQSLRPFRPKQIAEALNSILISRKAGKRVATTSKRKVKGKTVQKDIIVPRGALSQDTCYGKKRYRIKNEIKVNTSLTKDIAQTITNSFLKKKVLDRLASFEDNPKKAFKQYILNPIYIDAQNNQPLLTVEVYEWKEDYVIRRALAELTAAQIPKIVDDTIRTAIERRIEAEGSFEKAKNTFTERPIYQSEASKIPVKSIRCFTGLKEVEAIITDDRPHGNKITQYVSPKNNHQIAIYEDQQGALHEHVVTFWNAVNRKTEGLPVVIEDIEQLWDQIGLREDISQSVLQKLPQELNWRYRLSMQQGEYFIFNMELDELKAAIHADQKQVIAPHLFYVRKLTKGNFWFNQQYETQPKSLPKDKKAMRCIQASKGTIVNAIKVRISRLGEIEII
ncbi:type II CRISPR RNA-guided endonuclease Cas9 [Persicobacter psychrovividus]